MPRVFALSLPLEECPSIIALSLWLQRSTFSTFIGHVSLLDIFRFLNWKTTRNQNDFMVGLCVQGNTKRIGFIWTRSEVLATLSQSAEQHRWLAKVIVKEETEGSHGLAYRQRIAAVSWWAIDQENSQHASPCWKNVVLNRNHISYKMITDLSRYKIKSLIITFSILSTALQ